MNESNRTIIELAGISFALCFDVPASRIQFDPAYEGFQSQTTPDISIYCRYEGLPEPLPTGDQCVFVSESIWRAYRRNGKEILLLTLPWAHLPFRMASFDSEYSSGQIYTDLEAWEQTSRTVLPFPLTYPLGPLVLMGVLPGRRGLLVHACGIDDCGTGYAFVGSSTYGKSTMARLWHGSGVVLNDDRVVIRDHQEGYRVYGTPWRGDYPTSFPGGTKLEKVFLLQKSEKNASHLLTPGQASVELFKRSSIPLWDVTATSKALDFIDRLVARVPCYVLEFVPDESIIDYIRCTR
jgi:hypothetical protein